jgi:DNA repair exonuclease SbcCD ATPase subunit
LHLIFTSFLCCIRTVIDRHTSLLDRSQTLRERAEKAEAEVQHELATLRDKFSTLHVEETRLRRELEIERAAWEKERARLAKQHEVTITAMQEDKEKSLVQAHTELRDKIAELNDKMHTSIQKIRESDTEALRHELEGQRIRALAELHKKCQADIESVRTEERRLAAIEIENIRNAFLSREHQTAEDLVQLERLHGTRVEKLEQQLQTLRAENGSLQERLRTAAQEAQHASQKAQRGEAEMRNRVDGYAQRAEVLHRELLDAHKEIQESKAREASYRDQLSQAITQNRLQHAELLELKQQVSSGTAQVFQWRNVTRESDLSISAAETALRIAKDEVAMLEHQLHRVEEENALLKLELQRSDRLVYGAQMGSVRTAGDGVGLNTTSLSTAHLLRGSLHTPLSKSAAVNPALLSQTMSSAARTTKGRKSSAPKR